VELYIHDISGKRIKTLFIGQRSSGSHIVSWDGKNNVGKHVSAGLYFYTLDTPSDRQTKKLILIK
jgi:flagellar hook assembly protein FlgD